MSARGRKSINSIGLDNITGKGKCFSVRYSNKSLCNAVHSSVALWIIFYFKLASYILINLFYQLDLIGITYLCQIVIQLPIFASYTIPFLRKADNYRNND